MVCVVTAMIAECHPVFLHVIDISEQLSRRHHSALDRHTSDAVYLDQTTIKLAA